MTFTYLAWYSFWILSHIFQGALLVILIRRRLYRQLQVFTAYVAFEFFQFIFLFLIFRPWSTRPAYFMWFSFGLAVSTALRFALVYEIFVSFFANYAALRRLEKPLFRWAMALFLGLGFCFAVYTHRADLDPRWFAVYVLDTSTSLVQCGLLLCLFVFAALLHLRWRRQVFGIALGLGIFLSVDMTLAAIRSQLGRSWRHALDLVSMGTYLGCVLIWLVYISLPERRPAYTVDALPDHDLDAWNQEMRRLLQQP